MATTTTYPASPKQLDWVKDIFATRVTDLPADFAESIATLSKDEASEIIDKFKNAPKKATAKAPAKTGVKGLPLSKYAVEVKGELIFGEVKEFKGTIYFRQLIGSPGDWQRIKLAYNRQTEIVNAIYAVTPAVAIKRYADEYTCCAKCGSPLSDPVSRAYGLGPDCRQQGAITW